MYKLGDELGRCALLPKFSLIFFPRRSLQLQAPSGGLARVWIRVRSGRFSVVQSAEHLEGLVSGLHEEEGADNPYAWSIDKLLAFCEANGVRRVSKRKKQAGLVVDFQTRRANAAHEELVVREEGAYVDVETRWNNLRKQVRRLVDSRRTSAEERFDSETFRPK